MDDRLLIARAQRGDRKAVDELLRRYEPLALKARRMAPHNSLKDDYEQTVRIAVFRAIPKYQEYLGRRPSYFFFEAARKALHNLFRSHRRWYQRAALDDMDAYAVEDDFTNGVIAAVDAASMTQQLKPDYLKVLDLYYVQEQGPSEIGTADGRTPYAVDAQRKYILNKIRCDYNIELAA